jgi:glutamate racemase
LINPTERLVVNLKIGVFDSGIGGLTVLHQAVLSLPEEEFLYFADVDHVPYGTKTKEEIIGYADQAVHFMVKKGVKAIVIACNTATSVAIGSLRKKYSIPILGMEPAVKPAVQRNHGKRVMVIATPVTVREKKLKNLLTAVDENHIVDLLALPKLVPFAEQGQFDTAELKAYLRSAFAPYCLRDYSALVLGCTHFNYFKDTFREIFSEDVDLIDGCVGTINHLVDVLKAENMLENHGFQVDYYLSGKKVEDDATLRRIEKLHRRLDKMLPY